MKSYRVVENAPQRFVVEEKWLLFWLQVSYQCIMGTRVGLCFHSKEEALAWLDWHKKRVAEHETRIRFKKRQVWP